MWALVAAYRVLSVLCSCWNFLYIVSFVFGSHPCISQSPELAIVQYTGGEASVVLRILGEAYVFAWLVQIKGHVCCFWGGEAGGLLEQILYKNVDNIGSHGSSNTPILLIEQKQIGGTIKNSYSSLSYHYSRVLIILTYFVI